MSHDLGQPSLNFAVEKNKIANNQFYISDILRKYGNIENKNCKGKID